MRSDDPVERAVWWEERDGGWVTAYRIAPADDGRPIITEIRHYPFEEGSRAGEWSGNPRSANGGVRSELARQVVTDRTLENVRASFEAQVDSGNGWPLPRFGFDPGRATDVIRRPQRIPDREPAEDAKVYADAKSRGDHPRLAVARHRGIEPDSASKRVRSAKDRELLTEDGEQTDKARELTG